MTGPRANLRRLECLDINNCFSCTKVIICRWYTNERPHVKRGWIVIWREQVRLSEKVMQLQGAHVRRGFLMLIFHMVLYILKLTWYRVTFKSIIVRRCITHEPAGKLNCDMLWHFDINYVGAFFLKGPILSDLPLN